MTRDNLVKAPVWPVFCLDVTRQCSSSGSSGIAPTPTQWHCGFLSQQSMPHSQQRVLITSSQSNWIYADSSVLSRVFEQVQYADKDQEKRFPGVSLHCLSSFFLTSLKYNFCLGSLFSKADPSHNISTTSDIWHNSCFSIVLLLNWLIFAFWISIVFYDGGVKNEKKIVN